MSYRWLYLLLLSLGENASGGWVYQWTEWTRQFSWMQGPVPELNVGEAMMVQSLVWSMIDLEHSPWAFPEWDAQMYDRSKYHFSSSLFFDAYLTLNFRAKPRPSRGRDQRDTGLWYFHTSSNDQPNLRLPHKMNHLKHHQYLSTIIIVIVTVFFHNIQITVQSVSFPEIALYNDEKRPANRIPWMDFFAMECDPLPTFDRLHPNQG